MDIRDELTDGRIVLRRHNSADVEPLYDAVMESREELRPWMNWMADDYSMENTRYWTAASINNWDMGVEYNFLITEKETGVILGGCGLNIISQTNLIANLGYWVRTSRVGEGTATAVIKLLTGFAFNDLGFQRIEITIAVENEKSKRAAEKGGAELEGIMRNSHRLHGVSHDGYMFSIIPSDLK
ncbi:MAG TPA: GNAT family protein [bacterium]|nr:GNAT family protein [bacterium]